MSRQDTNIKIVKSVRSDWFLDVSNKPLKSNDLICCYVFATFSLTQDKDSIDILILLSCFSLSSLFQPFSFLLPTPIRKNVIKRPVLIRNDLMYYNQIIPMSSQQSLLLSRGPSRKGCKYAKIPLAIKIRLFRSVLEEGLPIKQVSAKLQIKYSTAKTLVRQFKDEQIKVDLKVIENETNHFPGGNSESTRCGYRQIASISHQSQGKDDALSEMNLTTIISQPQAGDALLLMQPRNYPRVLVVSTTISQL